MDTTDTEKYLSKTMSNQVFLQPFLAKAGPQPKKKSSTCHFYKKITFNICMH